MHFLIAREPATGLPLGASSPLAVGSRSTRVGRSSAGSVYPVIPHVPTTPSPIGCAPKPVMGRFPLASGRTTPIISTTIRLDFCRARLIRLSSHNPTASRLTLHPEKNRGPVTAVKTESGLIGQPPGSDLHLAFVRCGSTPPYNQSAPGEAGGATFLRACSPSLVVPRTN